MTRVGARQLAHDVAALLLVFRAHATCSFDASARTSSAGARASATGAGAGGRGGENARGNGSVDTYMRHLRDVVCVLSWPEADWLRYRQPQAEARGSVSGSTQARGRHAAGTAPAHARVSSGGGGGLFHDAELAALFAAQGVQSLGVAHVRSLLAHLMLTRADAERARAADDDAEGGDDDDDDDGSDHDSDEFEHEAYDDNDDDGEVIASDAEDAEDEVAPAAQSSAAASVGSAAAADRRGDFERFLDEGFEETAAVRPVVAVEAKSSMAAAEEEEEDVIEFNDEWRVDEEPEEVEDDMNLR